jgi:hypothetical protein
LLTQLANALANHIATRKSAKPTNRISRLVGGTPGHRFLTTLAAGGNDNPFVQSESLAGIIFRDVYVLIQTNSIIGRPASRISGVVATTTMALE